MVEKKLIQLQDVIKSYPQFKLHCSMELKEGYITGLIGLNGAGKSTTFKTILGLITPDSGVVTVFGRTRAAYATRQREYGRRTGRFWIQWLAYCSGYFGNSGCYVSSF